jgi:7,8-dihydroneopterin aldolase/epimerase/oxygenase
MTDRIVLENMAFQARHGVREREKVEPQRFDVDVELELDLQPAGLDDDLSRTVDYGAVYATVRQVVESTTFNLIEALAEAICHQLLAEQPLIGEVTVRVRKPEVQLGGPLNHAMVEVRRRRSG